MIGKVDDHSRALLDIEVRTQSNLPGTLVTAWVDTAFDGHLVFSKRLIEELQLEFLADTDAILADGSIVNLETFICYLIWFGEVTPLQVIANDGKLPLLGTGLLDHRVLHIDYKAKTLTLE